MFGWFAPRCPCDPHAKAWLEQRLHWLYDQFPDNVYNGREMILPLEQYFPDPYRGASACVEAMFRRVCEYMEVDRDTVDLEIVDEMRPNFWLVNRAGDVLPQAAGTFSLGDDRFLVRIDRAGLGQPMDLVGTMAHELAHVRLLGEGRCDAEEFDNELLTDLTVVQFGLGLFLANVPRHYRSLDSCWPGTEQSRPEYMTPPMFAWALAHVAWHHQQRWPPWAAHLYAGPRAELKAALRYLWTSEDSTFRP
jgi:hypothetical protein